jgi:hypothetical protein
MYLRAHCICFSFRTKRALRNEIFLSSFSQVGLSDKGGEVIVPAGHVVKVCGVDHHVCCIILLVVLWVF